MSTAVRTTIEGHILLIELNRPKANAIDARTSCELYEAFAHLQENAALRVAIITGHGEKFFSAGWDLKAAAAGEAVDADHGPGGFAGLTEFFALHKPVIAAVNGLAFGGGFELALAADLIVAAEHAQFALPEVGLGIIPDAGGVLRLPQRLPRAIAVDMLLTGRRMSSTEAAQWGLVNTVVPPAQLLRTALDLAHRIAEGAPMAVASIKETLQHTAHLPAEDGYRLMRGGTLPRYRSMLASQDAAEGIRAFAEKRKPQWRGR
ncbi:enoyl-CoA hydratase-related protein [Dyella tabacisoli]|uniref:Crotonobetainyl-CoA hydratase n=1 Tax=Dyella tabacisoli TaxID=2282381 RepID=A0A369UNI9_9GAMM|nr:enoyl-CoA hydratase-related protein [Dyella tabacisoli]RDD82324.1 crotonobetainyl-CoA hydratase [Dyella tabacisoli]